MVAGAPTIGGLRRLRVATSQGQVQQGSTNTAITTVGNGTLTAAAIVGGLITRTGPVANYTDTTATASDILNAINATITPYVGYTFEVDIKNGTSFTETLAAGTGVTLPTTVTIGPLSTGTYQFVVTGVGANAAVTATHITTVNTNPRITWFRAGAQTDATTTTLANITGLTGMVLTAGATYAYAVDLATTAGGTGGFKIAFNYTTATLAALNAQAVALTASAVAETNVTSTTTQASLVASNTAYTNIKITGTIVVTLAGTLDLQFAENSANSTSSILVGSTMMFTRIA